MYIMLKRSTKNVLLFTALAILAVFAVYVLNLITVDQYQKRDNQGILSRIPVEYENFKLVSLITLNTNKSVYKKIFESNFFRAFLESDLLNNTLKNKFYELIRNTDVFVAALYSDANNNYRFLLGIKGENLSINKTRAILMKISSGIVAKTESSDNNAKFDFIFIANDQNLLAKVYDPNELHTIKAEYDWIYSKLDKNSDAVVLTNNENFSLLLKNIALDYFKFDLNQKYLKGHSSLHQFVFSEKIFIKSASPYKSSELINNSINSDILNIFPEKMLMFGLSPRSSSQIASLGQIINVSDILDNEFFIDIKNYFKNESGYIILGPSISSLEMLLPNLILIAQVKDSNAVEEVYDKFKNTFNGFVNPEKYLSADYSWVSIPTIMGKKMEICFLPIIINSKYYVILTNSRSIVENLVDVKNNKIPGFTRTLSYRDIKKSLKNDFLNISYIDPNALSRTVGLFIVSMQNDKTLIDLFMSSPLAWLGPVLSVSDIDQGYCNVNTSFRTIDLPYEIWQDLFFKMSKIK